HRSVRQCDAEGATAAEERSPLERKDPDGVPARRRGHGVQRLLAPDPAFGTGSTRARGDDGPVRGQELGVEIGPPVVLEAEAAEPEDTLGRAVDDDGRADGDGEVTRSHGEVAGPGPLSGPC